MNITEILNDLIQAIDNSMNYQEYCENYPALVTMTQYNLLLSNKG